MGSPVKIDGVGGRALDPESGSVKVKFNIFFKIELSENTSAFITALFGEKILKLYSGSSDECWRNYLLNSGSFIPDD